MRPGVRFTVPFAIVLAAGLLGGCEPAAPVSIGFVGGLTGRSADLGVEGRNGAQLAVETLNAEKDAGARYELVVQDDRQDPARAASAIEELADRHVAFAVGPMTSSMALAMLPAAERRGLVLISPTANSDELSGKDDHFFRVITPASVGARQLAATARQRKLETVSILLDVRNRSYSESYANAFAQAFEGAGGRVPARVGFESGAPDPARLAADLLAPHPQAVLLVCGATDASIAAQQLHRIAPDVQVLVTSWAANDQLLQLGGRAVEHALVQQILDLSSHAPAYEAFRTAYQSRFGAVPGQAAAFGYVATQIGARALRQVPSGGQLRDVLRRPASWPGLQGTIELDRFGDSASPFHLSEIRGGRFEMIPG